MVSFFAKMFHFYTVCLTVIFFFFDRNDRMFDCYLKGLIGSWIIVFYHKNYSMHISKNYEKSTDPLVMCEQ